MAAQGWHAAALIRQIWLTFLPQGNLRRYVDRIFNVITTSGVRCPTVMCDIFFSLRESAATRFQGNWPRVRLAQRINRHLIHSQLQVALCYRHFFMWIAGTLLACVLYSAAPVWLGFGTAATRIQINCHAVVSLFENTVLTIKKKRQAAIKTVASPLSMISFWLNNKYIKKIQGKTDMNWNKSCLHLW